MGLQGGKCRERRRNPEKGIPPRVGRIRLDDDTGAHVSNDSNTIFLSYATQDAAAARRICDALRATGVGVWFDQSELRGGDAWDNAIRQRIKSCALFIAVISRNTHQRDEGYFRLEWKLAVDRSHLMSKTRPFLIPVVIDDAPNDDQVPDRFREIQWTRLPGGETPAKIGRAHV